MTAINLQSKLSRLTEHWQPRIIAQVNDYHTNSPFTLASLCGTHTRKPMSCSGYTGAA